MIVFDLKCERSHVFEAWFADSAAYDAQVKRGAVSCPACGSTLIDKALMAPNVARGKANEPAPATAPADPKAAHYMQMLYQMRDHVEKTCDYVGPKFADEARKIHHGEVDKHNIYGEATTEESRELKDEGVEFNALPWPRHDA